MDQATWLGVFMPVFPSTFEMTNMTNLTKFCDLGETGMWLNLDQIAITRLEYIARPKVHYATFCSS